MYAASDEVVAKKHLETAARGIVDLIPNCLLKLLMDNFSRSTLLTQMEW